MTRTVVDFGNWEASPLSLHLAVYLLERVGYEVKTASSVATAERICNGERSDLQLINDKLRILAAMKKVLGNRLTTVFPRQGHYALDPHNIATYPAADRTIERIGDLVKWDS